MVVLLVLVLGIDAVIVVADVKWYLETSASYFAQSLQDQFINALLVNGGDEEALGEWQERRWIRVLDRRSSSSTSSVKFCCDFAAPFYPHSCYSIVRQGFREEKTWQVPLKAFTLKV